MEKLLSGFDVRLRRLEQCVELLARQALGEQLDRTELGRLRRLLGKTRSGSARRTDRRYCPVCQTRLPSPRSRKCPVCGVLLSEARRALSTG
ncbi:MAG: hypothetical protein D6806_17525 [Deltaproteobacteria bacterium]|nr:MAG: hypothetical protein D6806_17525 [Deltaproteobacteria bacterium]